MPESAPANPEPISTTESESPSFQPESDTAPRDTEDEGLSRPEDQLEVQNRLANTEQIVQEIYQWEENQLRQKEADRNSNMGFRERLGKIFHSKGMKIASKILLGGGLALAAGGLAGPFGLAIAPIAYNLGARSAIDGALEAVSYLCVGRRLRLKMEAAKGELLMKSEDLRHLALNKEEGRVSSEEYDDYVTRIIKEFAETEEEVMRQEQTMLKWDKAESTVRAIASVAGTVALGIFNGIPLGTQDFDGDKVAHAVRVSRHGFDFIYNAGESMAGTTHQFLDGAVGHAIVSPETVQLPGKVGVFTGLLGLFGLAALQKQLARKALNRQEGVVAAGLPHIGERYLGAQAPEQTVASQLTPVEATVGAEQAVPAGPKPATSPVENQAQPGENSRAETDVPPADDSEHTGQPPVDSQPITSESPASVTEAEAEETAGGQSAGEGVKPENAAGEPIPAVQVITDIDGNLAALEKTLNTKTGKVIFRGNFMGSGGDSLAVLETIQQLVEAGRAEFSLGENEKLFIEAMTGDDNKLAQWYQQGGKAFLEQVGIRLNVSLAELRANQELTTWVKWLQKNQVRNNAASSFAKLRSWLEGLKKFNRKHNRGMIS